MNFNQQLTLYQRMMREPQLVNRIPPLPWSKAEFFSQILSLGHGSMIISPLEDLMDKLAFQSGSTVSLEKSCQELAQAANYYLSRTRQSEDAQTKVTQEQVEEELFGYKLFDL